MLVKEIRVKLNKSDFLRSTFYGFQVYLVCEYQYKIFSSLAFRINNFTKANYSPSFTWRDFAFCYNVGGLSVDFQLCQ